MKNKLTFSLAAALAFTLIPQERSIPENKPLSLFIPSMSLDSSEVRQEDEKLVILDGDSEEVEYSFKLCEIFSKLFE